MIPCAARKRSLPGGLFCPPVIAHVHMRDKARQRITAGASIVRKAGVQNVHPRRKASPIVPLLVDAV